MMENKKASADEIIQNEGLGILTILPYDNIIGFVFENIRRKSLSSFLYYSLNLANLAILIYFSIKYFTGDAGELKNFAGIILLAFLSGSFLVIPIHEALHAIAYFIKGAKRLKFGMDLKQMIFYVAADRHIISSAKFKFVAMAPFLIINLSGIALLLSGTSASFQSGISCFLLFHNIMCIGDFSMISFFQSHKGKELCTFDLVEERQSYICERLKK